MLYLKGFEIIPIMLSEGDYVIGDLIGVERKDYSTGDFSSSLRSGRLKK